MSHIRTICEFECHVNVRGKGKQHTCFVYQGVVAFDHELSDHILCEAATRIFNE